MCIWLTGFLLSIYLTKLKETIDFVKFLLMMFRFFSYLEGLSKTKSI
jgi:hypothetical protein